MVAHGTIPNGRVTYVRIEGIGNYIMVHASSPWPISASSPPAPTCGHAGAPSALKVTPGAIFETSSGGGLPHACIFCRRSTTAAKSSSPSASYTPTSAVMCWSCSSYRTRSECATVRVALAHALSARAREGRLVVFDNLAELCGDHPAKKYKTGPLRKMLNDLLINKLEAPRVSALLCDEGPEVEEPPPPPPLQFFAMREGALPPGPWVPARTGKRDKLPRKVLELAEAAGWKPEPPSKAGPKQGDRAHDGLYLAARNIPFVDVCPRAFMGCWWVIKHDFLLMDRRSLDGIVKQYLKIMKMRKK